MGPPGHETPKGQGGVPRWNGPGTVCPLEAPPCAWCERERGDSLPRRQKKTDRASSVPGLHVRELTVGPCPQPQPGTARPSERPRATAAAPGGSNAHLLVSWARPFSLGECRDPGERSRAPPARADCWAVPTASARYCTAVRTPASDGRGTRGGSNAHLLVSWARPFSFGECRDPGERSRAPPARADCWAVPTTSARYCTAVRTPVTT